MKRIVKSCLLLALLVTSPAPCLAEDPPPFEVMFRQENSIPGDVSTRSDLYLTVVNQSGAEIRDVTVSAIKPNPFFVINIPIPFDSIPDGIHKELLVPADVPNVDVTSNASEEIIWQITYTSSSGETKSVEVVGERGGNE